MLSLFFALSTNTVSIICTSVQILENYKKVLEMNTKVIYYKVGIGKIRNKGGG